MEKYKVVWKTFFASDQIKKENLSKDKAEKLKKKLNKLSDEYEYAVVVPQETRLI